MPFDDGEIMALRLADLGLWKLFRLSVTTVETYLELAERPNTGRSYAAAVKHFEQEWRGLLPATPDSVARYLADQATAVSINTLRLRLAGLSRWHTDHGFPDPTKANVVIQVFKGIRAVHSAPERQAKPLELLELQRISDWLESAPPQAGEDARIHHLRRTRDRAMLLIGFWRGFRADELTRLEVENIAVESGVGMSIYLPRSKGDRDYEGRRYQCPALSKLCPVGAYDAWIAAAGLTEGPVFRKIDRWGNLGSEAIAAGSVISWQRRLFQAAGVAEPERYSSHSLRRGFAGWARSSGWDLKALMEYVGWKDVASAMRYLDTASEDLQARFERGLTPVADSERDPRPPSGKAPLPVASSGWPNGRPPLKIIK